MKSYSLYANGSIGNHGCEALYRSLRDILRVDHIFTLDDRDTVSLFWESANMRRSTINRSRVKRFSYDWFMFRLFSLWKDKDYVYYRRLFRHFDEQIIPGNIYASIGGDNYCYGGLKWLYALNDIIRDKKGHTVLLGCSITPEDIDDMMLADLKKFDLIIARESITYQALRDRGITRLELLPDPAFFLRVEKCELPSAFLPGKTVGINMSGLIAKYEKKSGILDENMERLIRFILKDTDMSIALIPHVVLPDNDDLAVMRPFYEKYADTGRVSLIPDMNCCKLKYIIGKCRFIVATRTHASIAAYSQAVPTLVVGYSVKAEGIAKDLFGSVKNYVKDVRSLAYTDEIISCFRWLIRHEENIKKHYRQHLVHYMQPLSCMKQIIRDHLFPTHG